MSADTPGVYDGTYYVPVDDGSTFPLIAQEDLDDAFWVDQAAGL